MPAAVLSMLTAAGIVAALHIPLGSWLHAAFTGQPHSRVERLVYRLALQDGVVTTSPLAGGLRLPADRGRRDRIVPPDEAAARIAALLPGQRAAPALWHAARHRHRIA